MQSKRSTECRLYNLARDVFDLLRELNCADGSGAIEYLPIFGYPVEQRAYEGSSWGDVIEVFQGESSIWIQFKEGTATLFGETFEGSREFIYRRT